MALEIATYITELNTANPAAGDLVAQGDDHVRLLKNVLQSSFPNVNSAIVLTSAQINDALLKQGGTMTGNLILWADPTGANDAVTKAYADRPYATFYINTGAGLEGDGTLSSNVTINIANDGVVTAMIANDAVTGDKIADLSINTNHLIDGSVTTDKIANNAITHDKMADDSVGADEIIDGSITPDKLTQKLTSNTIQNFTDKSVTFTDIPSWVKRISIQFKGVSLNAAGIMHVQVGTSGGLTTSGYDASSSGLGFHWYTTTNGFAVDINSLSLAYNGIMTLETMGSNTWVSVHTLSAAGSYLVLGAGAVSLGAALDRLQIRATDTNGNFSTVAFDAGSVNILYE